MRIGVTTTSFGESNLSPLIELREYGFEVVRNECGRRLTVPETIALLKDAVGVIAGTSPITNEVIEALPSLRVISRCGTGTDSVDLAKAAQSGIAVYTTPKAPALAVAELTVGLMLAVLRRIGQADRRLRSGDWEPLMGNLLTGKTVAIVGMGHVGSRLVRLLEPFEVRIYGVDPAGAPAHVLDHPRFELVSLSESLRNADVVSIHVPYNDDTRHLIADEELDWMKAGAVLVNTSRGGIVDERALCSALDSGHLGGAGVDVFEEEPYSGALVEESRVVLTCHMGSYAEESRAQMEQEAVNNLLTGLRLANVI